ncbi:hypothetical protein B0T26DRAFT_744601 [Lasiosphaeria miniovina]|uniref:EKC/KEOPS complex subunit BUD32 n=1 Tax=Lasiosphaeria miniovina TaxID=1954250 RepID=A0AA40DHQ1_9PEZI|nr:uncharacterized protein B0T26DRAFT_744601 [Lasiosphaeria miniovina]KAK0703969.1 hypothetical protein B0T26DRAFT_744601 [Lasiosphaeria miniovina]
MACPVPDPILRGRPSQPPLPEPASIAGSTRVFGEFHHDNTPLADDDDDILRFCEHAHQVLKTQSARCFVHGFLVRGTALELWVFDRSGAYSSERLDLAQRPDLLVRILAGYALMSDEEAGFNTFVKHHPPESDSYVTFRQRDKLHSWAGNDYIVGLGTTCYAASVSTVGEPDTVVKFSWREDKEPTEVRLLERAHERNAWGVVQLVGYQDLVSIADLRQGLQFPQTFVTRTFSCVATTPLGRPIRQYTSITELLEVLRDLVKALPSLYVDARILHRDVAIKNLIITPQYSADGPKGVLIDFNYALDLDNARPIEPMVGSDGFMAIGILRGQRHTYRHDLESLFYVFLWIAIANDRVRDEANDILKGMPKASRLWKWCTMDFGAVGRDKAADMSPEGFEGILGEFSSDFAPLQGLAKELHALIFPVRDGEIFTVTETDQTYAEDLAHLRKLLDVHNMPASVNIKLMHIHFHLREGEILAVHELDAPPYGKIPFLEPMAPDTAGQVYYGCNYVVDGSGHLQAFEYTTIEGGPDLAAHAAFVAELCAVVVQRGLQHKFGLAINSGAASRGSWMELDFPEKRATFLLPSHVPLPQSDRVVLRTTITKFPSLKNEKDGNKDLPTHIHAEHTWGKRRKTDADDEEPVDGVTTKNGLLPLVLLKLLRNSLKTGSY